LVGVYSIDQVDVSEIYTDDCEDDELNFAIVDSVFILSLVVFKHILASEGGVCCESNPASMLANYRSDYNLFSAILAKIQ
jgi:hypothetical protein